MPEPTHEARVKPLSYVRGAATYDITLRPLIVQTRGEKNIDPGPIYVRITLHAVAEADTARPQRIDVNDRRLILSEVRSVLEQAVSGSWSEQDSHTIHHPKSK